MKILVVNHYAGHPGLGMEFRPYHLGREWVKSGHDVLIVGGVYSHLRKHQPKAGNETIDGIAYRWLRTPRYNGNGVVRFLSMLCFTAQLFLHFRAWRRFKPDVVIASSTYTLDNWPAHRIARRNNAKYIYEIHDLWPLSPMELGGMSAKHPFIRLMQWGEDYAYRHADKVVSILPCVHEHVKAHGLPLEKLALVPNGVVAQDWLPENREELPEEHRVLLEKLKSENKFLLGYAGGHGVANALSDLIEAMGLIKDRPDIALVLVGDGLEKERLRRQAASRRSEVYFLPSVGKRCMPALLAEFDVLLLAWHRSSVYRFGVSPNKIFDYMMAAKPIVMALEAGNDLIAEAGCGWCVAPENPSAIAQAIKEAVACGPARLAQLGENGNRYVRSRHDFEALAADFIQAVEKV
ncbi:MAG: glycosyltransferase family 4 protein [Bacteroidales bacterium]|nr:glycosyltransferase family 4 protein [Bacteroidales bacterium]